MSNLHSPPKILVVDDIPENLFALEKILDPLDAEIIRAASGNDALTKVLDFDFALIILDIQMPEMDGYEVAEILKSDEKTEKIPIIFVTAIDRDSTKELKGYDTGAVDFIFKPLNKFILLSKVKVFLELHRVKSGLEQMVEERTLALRQSNDALTAQMEKNSAAAREIEQGRAYLSKVIDTIPSCLITVDGSGAIVDMNIQAETLGNISMEAAAGKPVSKIFPFYSSLMKHTLQAIESETPIEKRRISTYIKGRLVINDFAIYPFRFNERFGAVIRVDDVTEQAQKDERMIQSEKMLSMGGIAAGMAHEINNPLSGMIQNIQVIRNRIEKDLPANLKAAEACGLSLESLKDYFHQRGIIPLMEAVHQSGSRAAGIVENMLSFSRKSVAGTTNEDLPRLMDKSIQLALTDFRFSTGERTNAVAIHRFYEDEFPKVPCHAGKIQQVFVNILRNALQALKQKEFNDGEEKELTVRMENSPSGMAHIEISDNGPGIDASVVKKIFEPFFTTKNNGSGLGLSISYFIISEDHGGEISVTSRKNKGTTFIIQLPLKRNDA